MEKFEMVYSEISKIIRLLLVSMGIMFLCSGLTVISLVWISETVGMLMGLVTFLVAPIYLIVNLITKMAVPCLVSISERGLSVVLDKDSQIYLDRNIHFSWSEVSHVEEKQSKGAYYYSIATPNKNFNLNFRRMQQLEKNYKFIEAIKRYKKLD